MSTSAPDLPLESRETPANDFWGMFNFFIDAKAASRLVPHKWFWVGPLLIMSVVAVASGILLRPIVQHVLEVAPLPPNATPEQFQKGISIGMTIQQVFTYLAPIVVGVMLALQSLIMFATCSVAGVKASFRSLFNISAGCGLITVLGSIATLVILKAKGQVETQAELQPPLGLDIFMSEGANKFALAFLGYFTVFNVWWLVMIVFVLSASFRIGKGKAFGIVLPWVLLTLILKVGAAAFQR